MHLSVYTHDANPAIDRRLCRKSLEYCSEEVEEGRASWLFDDKGRKVGIHKLAPEHHSHHTTKREPSIGGHGVISVRESHLNSENHHKQLLPDPEQVRKLLTHYNIRIDDEIEQALAERRPLPRRVWRMIAEAKVLLWPDEHDTYAPTIHAGKAWIPNPQAAKQRAAERLKEAAIRARLGQQEARLRQRNAVRA